MLAHSLHSVARHSPTVNNPPEMCNMSRTPPNQLPPLAAAFFTAVSAPPTVLLLAPALCPDNAGLVVCTDGARKASEHCIRASSVWSVSANRSVQVKRWTERQPAGSAGIPTGLSPETGPTAAGPAAAAACRLRCLARPSPAAQRSRAACGDGWGRLCDGPGLPLG